jgi:diguanylate cyclase (GGDEF)-like protein/PAS domain S-box-containing protein
VQNISEALYMFNRRTVLLIDDDPAHAKAFREALVDAGDGPFEGEWVQTLAEGFVQLKKKGIWAVFLNLRVGGNKDLTTFDQLHHAAPDMPTLVLGGAGDKAIALEALGRGAKDYLLEEHIDCDSLSRAIRNMMERETAEDALFTEKARAQVTLDSIGDAVLSTDILGNVSYLNAVAEKMTGWSREAASGKPLAEVFKIIDGITRKPAPNPMELAIQKNKTVALTPNCILIRHDGSESAIEDSAAPIYDRSGAVIGAVIVFHDVSMSRAIVGEMKHLAEHDALTDLPNRMLLRDRITQAIATARRNNTLVAVVFLDLDQFKHINDSLGHAIGDKLLQSVAARLISCVRNTDTVSRQGGDEFVVLLSEVKHAADAGNMARKLLTALTACHALEGHDLYITSSIGVCTYPEDGDDAEILMKNADTAMYQAKEKGRNNYQFFKKEMNQRAVNRQSLEVGLRDALQNHHFVLHYQPKINLTTGAISGVEALIRWLHPTLGLLPPLEFLPIAEDCGLIVPIGRWVLSETCRQVQEWITAGLRVVPVAVNVSSLEFRSEGFLDNVRTILRITGLNPRYLELELTETVLMQHAESTLAVLSALKSIGARLAVDDFGTGYSSLSYLKRFPIDCLKIDQSFVRGITSGSDDVPIVRAVITMAKSLKQRVVGEGVETEAQMCFLQAHGCDEAQGYYLTMPLAAEDFAKMLRPNMGSFIPATSAKSGPITSPWLRPIRHSRLN